VTIFLKIMLVLLAFLLATTYASGFHQAGVGSLVLDVFIVGYTLVGVYFLMRLDNFGGTR
jgi:hypothetical protein